MFFGNYFLYCKRNLEKDTYLLKHIENIYCGSTFVQQFVIHLNLTDYDNWCSD